MRQGSERMCEANRGNRARTKAGTGHTWILYLCQGVTHGGTGLSKRGPLYFPRESRLGIDEPNAGRVAVTEATPQ